MTRNPMVTRDTTSATEALEVMVQRHFRHLPVCNEDGNVVGLLDITKVFHEALAKVERSSSASQKLYAALEGVQSEFGGGIGANPQAAAMMAYVDALRDKTALPDLASVIDARTHPAMVTPKTTVYEAAKLMKENRTTAVCVMEGAGSPGPSKIAGIFTSKDVVLRVIAAGLEPSRCSVVRVMTPHPDVASPSMTVQDALKKMHGMFYFQRKQNGSLTLYIAGHYLNLPVVEIDGRLIAVVDVLKLTYATLEQMSALAAKDADAHEGESGPLWGRFFESLAANDDADSAVSGSNARAHSFATPPPGRRIMPVQESPHSELYPGDSASAVEEVPPSTATEFPPLPDVAISSVGNNKEASIIDDGTYIFKFRTPSGQNHRFQALKDNVDHLRDIIGGKLENDPFFAKKKEEGVTLNPREFQLAYTDMDDDVVVISSNGDVEDAVKIARKKGSDRVLLQIQGGTGWESASVAVDAVKQQPLGTADRAVASIDGGAPMPPINSPNHADDEFYGISKELLLPASIAGLAAVIVAVFAISRLSRD